VAHNVTTPAPHASPVWDTMPAARCASSGQERSRVSGRSPCMPCLAPIGNSSPRTWNFGQYVLLGRFGLFDQTDDLKFGSGESWFESRKAGPGRRDVARCRESTLPCRKNASRELVCRLAYACTMCYLEWAEVGGNSVCVSCSRFEKAHTRAIAVRIARGVAGAKHRGRPPTWFDARTADRLCRAARRWVEHLERARPGHAHVFGFPAVGEVAGYLRDEITRQRQSRPRLLAAAALRALHGWNPEERDAKSRGRVEAMFGRWLPERRNLGLVLSWRLNGARLDDRGRPSGLPSPLPSGLVQFDEGGRVTDVFELRDGRRIRLRLSKADRKALAT